MAPVRSLPKARRMPKPSMFRELFHTELASEADVIALSREGVTKRSLLALGERYGFSPERISRMLPVTARTIQRYKPLQKFNPSVSEHIIQLARLMIKGDEVFDSREQFLRWFAAPNAALGGKAPNELVTLHTGVQLVMDELIRIDHGVFA